MLISSYYREPRRKSLGHAAVIRNRNGHILLRKRTFFRDAARRRHIRSQYPQGHLEEYTLTRSPSGKECALQ